MCSAKIIVIKKNNNNNHNNHNNNHKLDLSPKKAHVNCYRVQNWRK